MLPVILFAALAAAAGAAAAASRPPNILLVMADQMRWDTLGPDRAYGIELGNLTQLAARGAYFRRAYSTTPTCTPARSSLLTGLSPWWHGMLGYGDIAQAYPLEWPRILAQGHAGYLTAAVGKNHFMWNASANAGYAHGFSFTQLYDGLGNGINNSSGELDDYDRWWAAVMGQGTDPLATPGDNGQPLDWNSWRGAPQGYSYGEDVHPTAWTAAQAEAWLGQHGSSSTTPWALKVSFHRPHSPYDPPLRLLQSTPASAIPARHRGTNASSWDSWYSTNAYCGPSDPDAWCGTVGAAEEELSGRAYLASLRFVDEGVGRVLAALNATGQAGNTWILFLSDHGDGQGDHYLWRKGYPYEISAHVPMMAVWPEGWEAGVPRGSVVDAVVELRDVAPTLLDIAGVPQSPTQPMNGSSLACLLATPGASGAGCGTASGSSSTSPAGSPWRSWIDLEHDIVFNTSNHWSGGTDGGTKYVFLAATGAEQLFNLTADPYEMEDVAGVQGYQPVLQQWRDRLVQQYTAEGRGSGWVQGGKLVPRPQSQLYSPHYPGNPATQPHPMD